MPRITIFWLFLAIPAIASDGKFTDPRDGKKYRTVKIGEQVWMAENLNYNTKDSKCYENDTLYCNKYGRLYNWNMARVVCPKGWHLPSNAEWSKLMDFIGGYETAGKKLKAKSGWNDYEGESGNGTDDFGFSALPGGYCYCFFSDSSFYAAGNHSGWWSSTGNNYHTDNRYMSCNKKGENWSDYNKSTLFSVRCLQD